MIYYDPGQYLTDPDPRAWYVFAREGETGGVVECEAGPMTREQAEAMAMNKQTQGAAHEQTA